ncbi:MAG: T9SS type A sorting domain-containing protein [bacterium]|nr:T9SS type A sorting domain-containing protein [bacterium]
MKKLSLIFLYLLNVGLNAQSSYQQHILTSGYSDIRGIAAADNGECIISGLDKSTSDINGDMYAMKIDGKGKIIWQKNFGLKNEDGGNNILKLADNNYLITGHSAFYNQECDGYLVKIDGNGNKIWSLLVGDSILDDVLYLSIEDTDGNIYSVGRTESFGSKEYDVFLTKINKDGQLIFQKHFGDSMNEIGVSLCFTSDNNLILSGFAYDTSNNISNSHYLSCTKNGDLNWTKTMVNQGRNVLYKVIKFNNNVMMFGQKDDPTNKLQAYSAIINNAGDITKENTYGFKGDDIFLSAQIKDNVVYCLGYSTSYSDSMGDVTILKLDNNLNLKSINFYGTNRFDQCRDFMIQDDGSMTMVGISQYILNENSAFIIKTDASGTVGIHKENLTNSILIYPNPSNGIIHIAKHESLDFKFALYNTLGECVLESVLDAGNNNPIIDLQNYPNGIYLVKIYNNEGIYHSQFIIKQ